jgi:hypothetical protein
MHSNRLSKLRGHEPLVIGVHPQCSLWFRADPFWRYYVLHKCANPACHNPFRKLSQGKLFLVETEPLEGLELRRANWKGKSSHRIEYYWLCDQCAFVLTLSYEKGRGVVTVPRPEFARRPPATAHADATRDESRLTEQSA